MRGIMPTSENMQFNTLIQYIHMHLGIGQGRRQMGLLGGVPPIHHPQKNLRE